MPNLPTVTTPDVKSVDFGSFLLALVAAVGLLTYAAFDMYDQARHLPRVSVNAEIAAAAIGVIAHYLGRTTKGVTIAGKTYVDPFAGEKAAPAIDPFSGA